MKNFKNFLEEEIKQTETILRNTSLKGNGEILIVRPRSQGEYTFYKRVYDANGKRREINLKRDYDEVQRLKDERSKEIMHKIAENNLRYLKQLERHYKTVDRIEVINNLSSAYQMAEDLMTQERIEKMKNRDYEHAPFDPQRHIHETSCGLLVRSKSEVIIANTLTEFGIPFHYEEKLELPDAEGNFYYPDFTFRLIKRLKKIWEHLGMLNDLNYCISNGKKLNAYQRNNFLIGRNLIITQDDKNGGCNSAHIVDVIMREIMPYIR